MAMVALYFHMQNVKSKFVAHFCNNIAVFGGGGISGFLFLHNTNFSDNAAMEENGGAVEFQDGVVTIAGTSQFHTNTASGSDGALWLSNVEFTLRSSQTSLLFYSVRSVWKLDRTSVLCRIITTPFLLIVTFHKWLHHQM